MLDGGDVACVMEVSSHALELGASTTPISPSAVFTNLTQDHLDFHPTMEDYFQAKRRLFTEVGARSCGAEPRRPLRCCRLATDPEIAAPVTFALDHAGATYRADDVRTRPDRLALHPALTRRRRRSSARRCGAASTSPTCWRHSPRRARSGSRSTSPSPRSSTPGRSRVASRPSTRGSVRGAGRLRPHPDSLENVLERGS